jgi:putative membrane protein
MFVTWLFLTLALIITAYVVPGFKVKSIGPAIVAAVVVGLANTLIFPVLVVLTLPINILTLGLFTFVISAAMLKLSAALVSGFDIVGWGAAILGAVVMAVVNGLLRWIF